MQRGQGERLGAQDLFSQKGLRVHERQPRETPCRVAGPALARDLDRGNRRGDHRRRRLAPARLGRAMLIVVVDTAAFAVPLAELLLACAVASPCAGCRHPGPPGDRAIRAAAPSGWRATLTVERTG